MEENKDKEGRKVYIAVIGDWHRYCLAKTYDENNNYIGECKYPPFEKLKRGDIDILIIFREDTKETQKGIDEIKENLGEEFEKKVIDRKLNSKESSMRLIDELLNEIAALKDEDEIIIDFTHGKKNFTSTLLIIGSLLKVLNPEKTKILYIDHDCPKINKATQGSKGEESRYLDASYYGDVIAEIIKINEAVSHLSPEKMEEILKMENAKVSNEVKAQESEQEKQASYNKRSYITGVLGKLKNLLFAIRLGIVTDKVKSEIEEIIKEDVNDNKGKTKFILKNTQRQLNKIYERIRHNKFWKRQKELGDYMWDLGQYQLAVALIREAYISREIEKRGKKDLYNKDVREQIGWKLFNKNENKNYSYVSEIRNALEHVFTSNSHYQNFSGSMDELPKYNKINLNNIKSKLLKGFEDGDKDSNSNI